MRYTTTVPTPLGTFQVEADDKGISAIILPGSTKTPATIAKGTSPKTAHLELAARQIREYCDGVRREFDLPLSMRGTLFQQQVWEVIRTIPYGRTMSYGEIAGRLGNVSKARAVGGAAHANPLPLVIPCHRVIGTNGTLTGFGGGIELKKRLLDLERNHEKK